MRHLSLLLLLLSPLSLAGDAFPAIDTPLTGLVKDAGADVALILAIEDYTALPDVTGAAANARAWAAYLKARGVGTVKLMVNGDVTREQVLGGNGITGAAEQVRARLKDGGTVWLVYVGHGAPGDGSGALVGWDAQRTAASVTSRSIGQDELLRALGRDDGVPIVAVVDACFSGRTGAGELAPGVQPVRPVESLRAVRDATTLLVAARSDQYAGSMPGLGRPAFSWLALGALRGWADEDGDGAVTGAELVDWSGGRLVEAVNDRAQTPEVFGDGARVLGRGRERAPELVAVAALPVPAVGASTSFDDLSIDVSGQLKEQGCAEAARTTAEAARARKLDAEVTRLAAEASAAWDKLEPDATACLKLTDSATRATCARTVDAFVSRATGLTANLAAGMESAATECGSRSIAFPVVSRAVAVADLAVAKELAGRLKGAAPGSSGALATGKDWTSQTVGLMKWIPAGTFTMGSPASESGRLPNETQHSVTVTRGFLLMEHEVTQGEWEGVMGVNPVKSGTRFFSEEEQGSCAAGVGSTLPVACVSWLEAVGYANALSEKEGLTMAYAISGESVTANGRANGYRLPTEAEWERAGRGGERYMYAGGDELCAEGNVANQGRENDYTAMGYDLSAWTLAECDDGVSGLARVKSYRPNRYGLYDMSGNVWEWASDWYGADFGRSATDPEGPATGSHRVFRGGGWMGPPEDARVASRLFASPSMRTEDLGLRLARSLP